MQLTYFKRYRMEIDLAGRNLARPVPPGFRFLAWHPSLLDAHAQAKYLSFRDEIDANVFPCLGDWDGCRRLMEEISSKPGFLPEATWLAERIAPAGRRLEYVGTIQGIRDRNGTGVIQNVGIAPEHRDMGLGTCLAFHALEGFRRAGLRRVYLEVTAQNDGAIRLYRRLGFVKVKTVFKTVEVAYP